MRASGGYQVGAFQVNLRERLLVHGGRRVEIRHKAFELLALLTHHAGETVDKSSLMAALWPDLSVHENNLAVTIAEVRKVLSRMDDRGAYIETVPRYGYRLVAPVTAILPPPWTAELDAPLPSTAPRQSNPRPHAPDTPLPAAAEHWIGREPELRRLQAYWRHAAQGAGQLIFVSGEPGVGKSALVSRFARAVQENGRALVLRGQGQQFFGPIEPYLPFFEALSGGLRGSARGLLVDALQRHAPAWCARFPEIFTEPEPPRATSVEREVGPLALASALEVVSRAQPLLLVLEDLHWADPSSIDLLRLLASRVTTQCVLIVATYRSAEAGELSSPLRALLLDSSASERLVELLLLAWREEQVHSYLVACYAEQDFTRELARRLWQRSEGLPLFATRLAQSLVDRGLLRLTEGRWALAAPIEELDLTASESLVAVIRGHLSQLSPEERQTLELASVEGEEFGTALLARVLEADEVDVETRLERLASVHRLVMRVGEETLARGQLNVRYRFAHVLYKDFLYDHLIAHRRAELHRRTAEALLDQDPEAAQRIPARLALHWERGRDVSRACYHWQQAGDQAERAHSKREAVECYSRASALFEWLPADERLLRRLFIEHGLGWAMVGLAQLDAAEAHFLELIRLSRELARHTGAGRERLLQLVHDGFDRPWTACLINRPAHILPREARQDTALELEMEAVRCCCEVQRAADRTTALEAWARELLQLAETSGSKPRQAEALGWLGAHALLVGRLCEARVLLDDALRLANDCAHERALLLALYQSARLHQLQGAHERALAELDELLPLVPCPRTAAGILSLQAELHAKRGDLSLATANYQRAAELGRRLEPCVIASDGWLRRQLGQHAEAQRRDESALALLEPSSDHIALARVLASLCCTLCARGDVAQADERLRQAEALVAVEHRGCAWRMAPLFDARCELAALRENTLSLEQSASAWRELSLTQGDPEGTVASKRWLARLAARRGDRSGASRILRGALDIVRRRPMALTDWRLHADRHTLALSLGDDATAAAALAEARELLDRLSVQLSDAAHREQLHLLGESCFRQLPGELVLSPVTA